MGKKRSPEEKLEDLQDEVENLKMELEDMSAGLNDTAHELAQIVKRIRGLK